ncbi:winged helix-turn-helix transcriptional regulator [Leucothrix sargassi]|nr:winged helix-turn-helix transcriptional regulator [Leucothrix sargassi]
MTEREREIYALIEANPMISQAEIASLLSITRTSVAVHISNLVKKGHIMGKGYIMAYSQPITVIGGANVDIQGKPDQRLLMEDSNPGCIQTSLGGVGRNIADNVRKFDLDTRLITAVGDDSEGAMVKGNARDLGIDMELSIISNEHSTSTYLYVLDERGELVVAVSDMSVVKQLTPEYFKKLIKKIEHSPYTVLDANLPQSSIEYLAKTLVKTKLVLDPVSVSKAVRVKDVLEKFYAIKVNKAEAEALTGLSLDSPEQVSKAAKLLVATGVERVFITLGSQGVYYQDQAAGFFREAIPTDVVNATGAGDAFTAAMIYGFTQQLSHEALVDFCIGASTVALGDAQTIASNLSVEAVNTILSHQH